MPLHELKTHPDNFRQLHDGERTSDIRVNDRGFATGDLINFVEFKPEGAGSYTGRQLVRRVNRVFGDVPGLQPGYVLLTLIPAVDR